MKTTGVCVTSARADRDSRADPLIIADPASIIGLIAPATASKMVWEFLSVTLLASGTNSCGVIGLSTDASCTSKGNAMCTGPGLPDFAIRKALARSSPK